jgi:methyl-accepting chemotaxis protein
MGEQALAASQITQAVTSMRQGATSTARALNEQASATEQVTREADRLVQQIGRITKSLAEQSRNSKEITAAADDLRQQTSQAARAMEEQTRAVKNLNSGVGEISKQIRLITRANIEHSERGEVILKKLSDAATISSSTGQEAKLIAEKFSSLEVSELAREGKNGGSPAAKAGRRQRTAVQAKSTPPLK